MPTAECQWPNGVPRISSSSRYAFALPSGRTGSLAKTSLLRLRRLGAEGGEKLYRHREDDGRALVAGDVAERLQIAQLHRLRLLREHLRRLQQLFRSLQFALGVDDLGAALA